MLKIDLHSLYTDLGKTGNTKAIINCFKKYPIHVFTHPTYLELEYDLDKVLQAACDNNILLELNLSSLHKMEGGDKNQDIRHMKKMIGIVKKNSKKLLVNSDAHFLPEIGEDSILKRYRDELGLEDSLIINNYPEELEQFLVKR